jgi:membrane-bound metal-dependent hydrolase YbcI (DUF457 family)
MSGALAAHLLAGSNPEPALTLTALAAGIIPDFDFYSRKLPGATFLNVHHGATHSLFGALMLAASCALVSTWFFNLSILKTGPVNYLPLWTVSMIAIYSHLFLDWIMHNNGIPLLWPFLLNRFAFPVILGVNPHTVSRKCGEKKYLTCFGCQFRGSARNPVAWIITGGGIIGFFLLSFRIHVAVITGILCIMYLCLCIFMRQRAAQAVFQYDPSFIVADIYPARARPDRWLFIRGNPDGSADAILAESAAKAILRKWRFTPPLLSPSVTEPTSRVTADLKYAIRHLYPEVMFRENITHITFRDLSYLYAEPMEIGSVKVCLDQDGKLISEIYQEIW